MNLNDNNNFVGNAQECLSEAHKLDYKRKRGKIIMLRDLITIGFIHLCIFSVIFFIEKKYDFLSITELALVAIITSLIINIIYVTFSVIKIKRKYSQELRLDEKRYDVCGLNCCLYKELYSQNNCHMNL